MNKHIRLMMSTFKNSFKYSGRSSNLEFILFSISSLLYMFVILPFIMLFFYLTINSIMGQNLNEGKGRELFVSFFGPILDFLIKIIPVEATGFLMFLMLILIGILITMVLFGPILFASLSLIVRRLHDLGYSGNWLWAIIISSLVPILGVLVFLFLMIYLSIKKGNTEKNKYGEVPVL